MAHVRFLRVREGTSGCSEGGRTRKVCYRAVAVKFVPQRVLISLLAVLASCEKWLNRVGSAQSPLPIPVLMHWDAASTDVPTLAY